MHDVIQTPSARAQRALQISRVNALQLTRGVSKAPLSTSTVEKGYVSKWNEVGMEPRFDLALMCDLDRRRGKFW